MKIGDMIRIKKSIIVGRITHVFGKSERYCTAVFPEFFGCPITLRDDEFEILPANPCVCCGAETPEGRQVCGMCERRQI